MNTTLFTPHGERLIRRMVEASLQEQRQAEAAAEATRNHFEAGARLRRLINHARRTA